LKPNNCIHSHLSTFSFLESYKKKKRKSSFENCVLVVFEDEKQQKLEMETY